MIILHPACEWVVWHMVRTGLTAYNVRGRLRTYVVLR